MPDVKEEEMEVLEVVEVKMDCRSEDGLAKKKNGTYYMRKPHAMGFKAVAFTILIEFTIESVWSCVDIVCFVVLSRLIDLPVYG